MIMNKQMKWMFLLALASTGLVYAGEGAHSLPVCEGFVNPQAANNSSRPNIIFIMADDHAAHAISAYGSDLIHTPNMDRLAEEGIRFTNCFNVNSICGPSRAALISGKYSYHNGVQFLYAVRRFWDWLACCRIAATGDSRPPCRDRFLLGGRLSQTLCVGFGMVGV
jgi:hypothetical protein